MRAADIRDCVAVVAAHPVIGPRYQGALDDLRIAWRRLIPYEAKTMVVFEEVEGARVRTLGMGVSVFVDDDFMNAVKTPPFLWIGPELARRIARGRSPVLPDKQFREANARGGLNLLTWEGCLWPDDLKRAEVYNKVMSAFMEEHRGYLWKEILSPQAETVERFHGMLKSGGMLLNPANGRWEDSFSEEPREIITRPHVLGLTRDIEMRRPGSLAGMLFDYRPPCFGFSASEQRLLVAALRGGTDEALSDELGISLSAVKKRWRGLYDRVADAMPDLIPAGSAAAPGAPERAREKKRHLLAYLRDHPEELRPVARKHLPRTRDNVGVARRASRVS